MKTIKRRHSAIKTRLTPFTGTLLVFLILYSFILIGLLLWALNTSFKSQSDFRLNTVGLPKKFVWNYSTVFKSYTVPVFTSEGQFNVGMGEMFLYSLLYSLGCAFASTITPCITAYLCARFEYKFSKIIYFVVILTMIVPVVGNLPSEIQVAQKLGLFDRIWGLWVMKANFLGMYFLVFYNLFRNIPKEYVEAAKIDGAGNFTILTRVMLPLIRNTFFVIMLIKFIEFWNDYQTPLIYMESYPTVAYGMYRMATTRDNALSVVPMRMACAMLTFIPIFVVFMTFHKKLVGNLDVGGIKG